ncbi:MAG: spore germination protein [Oscillospiraceae bacterium]
MKLSVNLKENERKIKEYCSSSADVVINKLKVGRHNCLVMWCDGMTNHLQCYEILYKQLYAVEPLRYLTPKSLYEHFTNSSNKLYDSKTTDNYEDLINKLMSGCVLLLIDGIDKGISVSAQGYNFRAVSESYTEENVRSSREGFVEPIKVNITLVRRRIKSNLLVFESMQVGTISNTEISIAYLKDRVSQKLIKSIKQKLAKVDVELTLESGFVQPFLEPRKFSLFSSTGHTERPDTLCAKLLEGRVGIIVDGTPFALILPYLFSENFQSFDDYTNKPYYASLIRILKYIAFAVSFLLPGLYVAIVYFNPELLPSGMLLNIARAQQNTSLPLLGEALFIHFIYEVVREAGLRLPRPIGHAVSLIGALVIGDAAVSAGIIASPMVMTIALTSLCSFTIPMLYEPVTMLRLAFIIIGGLFGLVGITFALTAVLMNICALNSYGIPYMSPITPFSKPLFTDGFVRKGWTVHGGNSRQLTQMNGAHKLDE